jgi:hypothetical protein
MTERTELGPFEAYIKYVLYSMHVDNAARPVSGLIVANRNKRRDSKK